MTMCPSFLSEIKPESKKQETSKENTAPCLHCDMQILKPEQSVTLVLEKLCPNCQLLYLKR